MKRHFTPSAIKEARRVLMADAILEPDAATSLNHLHIERDDEIISRSPM